MSTFQDFTLATMRELDAARTKHPNEEGVLTDAEWLAVLTEEVGEVARSIQDEGDDELRVELAQVAAVVARWYASIPLGRRRPPWATRPAEDNAGDPECRRLRGPYAVGAGVLVLVRRLRAWYAGALRGVSRLMAEEYGGDVGSKDDAEKPRTDLLPVAPLVEVAHVFGFGAKKYDAYNWRGLSVSRLYGAALRHLFAYWRGEDNDPETGRSHLAHAACCVLMALAQMLERPEYDDRPK